MGTATRYATRFGWAVFPLPRGSKQPFKDTRGFKDATKDPAIINGWRATYGTHINLGIATGHISGIVVIDIDPPAGGEESWDDVLDKYGKHPDTVESLTPRGGRHIYFALPDGCVIRNDAGRKLGVGVDIRGDGGYVIAPPSVGANGRKYEWEGASDPNEGVEVAPLPDWLRCLIENRDQPRAPAAPIEGGAVEGRRNVTLTSLAGSMRRRGASEASILAALNAENDGFNPPLDPHEVDAIAHSVARYDPSDVATMPSADETARRASAPQALKDGRIHCTPEEIPWYHSTAKGRPLNTVENLSVLLAFAGITVCYNVITKDIEVRIPGGEYTTDNAKAASRTHIASLCEQVGMSTSKLDEYLVFVADANVVNPVLQWFDSHAWDGTSRWAALVDTVTCQDDRSEAIKSTLMRRWMLSAVHAAASPTGLADGRVLVLQGPQDIGKTSWLRKLCLPDMFLEGALLNPGDKDSVKVAVAHWIVELGELDATFRRADIAALKAFITKDRDIIRLPYGKAYSEYPRRTVFAASVNEAQFLSDPTGNKRFWTLPISKLDFLHGVDIQQVWAELLHYYRKGESYHVTDDEREAINEINSQHLAIDPIEELIRQKWAWTTDRKLWTEKLTASEVLVRIGFRQPTTGDAMKASRVLKSLVPPEMAVIGRGKTRYHMPPTAVGDAEPWA